MPEANIEELIEAARAVQGTFRLREPEFSAASVGAALQTTSGAVHTGVCIDVACGMGFCAEHAAIAEMLAELERNPYKPPERPASPDRSGMGITEEDK